MRHCLALCTARAPLAMIFVPGYFLMPQMPLSSSREPKHNGGTKRRHGRLSHRPARCAAPGTSRSPTPLLHLALQRGQPVEKVQNHGNASQICPQVTSEPLDHAQPRNTGRVKKPLRTRTGAGFEQTIIHEIFNERRMHPGARRQTLSVNCSGSVRRRVIGARGSRIVVYPFISSRGLKREAAASCSNKARSLSVSVGGLTNFSLTY